MAEHLMYLWVVSDEEIAAYLRRHGHQGDDMALVTSDSGNSLRRRRDAIGREVDGEVGQSTRRYDALTLAIPFIVVMVGVGLMTLGASMFPALGELIAPLYCGGELMTSESQQYISYSEHGPTQTTAYRLMCLGPDGPYEPRWVAAKAFGVSLLAALAILIPMVVVGFRRMAALREVHAQQHKDCAAFRRQIRGS